MTGRASAAFAALAIAAGATRAYFWTSLETNLVAALARILGSRLPRLAARAPFVAFPVAGVVVASFALEGVQFTQAQSAIPAFGIRDRLAHTVAAFLAASAAPTDTVDAEEVGTLAYLSGLPMVDHPGLVSTGDAVAQLFAAARRRPSRVRWAVLNPWELEMGKAAFAPYRSTEFDEGPTKLTVLDLRAPAR